ncbi:uncharacterized protein [Branchiostoma lanceolatum]|uniref:uncharacterized protein isoform X1 n=1 Tax=Branchiostoma lanceolatum TaxID=7740 RepID=UPI00345119ED
MKTALLFLACITVAAAQFWHPLHPCVDDTECPGAGYCCRFNNVIFQNLCELKAQNGWPCDPTYATSCACADGLVCMPNALTSEFVCQIEAEPAA